MRAIEVSGNFLTSEWEIEREREREREIELELDRELEKIHYLYFYPEVFHYIITYMPDAKH